MKQFPIDSHRLKSALMKAQYGVFKLTDIVLPTREPTVVEFCALDNCHNIWCNVEECPVEFSSVRTGVLKLINKSRGRFVRILGRASFVPGECVCVPTPSGNFILQRAEKGSRNRVLRIEVMHVVNYVKRTGNIEIFA